MKKLDWLLLAPALWLLLSLATCYAFGAVSYSRLLADATAVLFLSWYVFAPVGVLCSIGGIIKVGVKLPAGWKKASLVTIYLAALAVSALITYVLIRWGGGIQQT